MSVSIGEYKRKLEAGTLTTEERREWQDALRKIAEAVQAARPRIGRLLIKAALINYRAGQTPNPIYLWDAYRIAMRYSLTIPEEVENYLMGCAEALTAGEHKTPRALLHALGLQARGQGTFSTRYKRLERWLDGPELDVVSCYLNNAPGYETQGDAAEKLGLGDDREFRRLLADLKELASLDLNDSDI